MDYDWSESCSSIPRSNHQKEGERLKRKPYFGPRMDQSCEPKRTQRRQRKRGKRSAVDLETYTQAAMTRSMRLPITDRKIGRGINSARYSYGIRESASSDRRIKRIKSAAMSAHVQLSRANSSTKSVGNGGMCMVQVFLSPLDFAVWL